MLAMATDNPSALRIREARVAYGATQKEFAAALGVTRDQYKNWEYGLSAPPADLLARAVALGQASGLRMVASVPMSRAKIVGAASAGPGTSDHPDDAFVWVPSHMCSPQVVAWIVEGDSMMPWLLPGDVVLIKAHKVPRVGYPFLIRRDDGSSSLKVIKYGEAGFAYHSLNPRYPDEPATGSLLGFMTGRYRIDGTLEVIEHDPSGMKPPDIF